MYQIYSAILIIFWYFLKYVLVQIAKEYHLNVSSSLFVLFNMKTSIYTSAFSGCNEPLSIV